MKKAIVIIGAALAMALSSCTVRDTAEPVRMEPQAQYIMETVRGVTILRRMA